MARLLLIDDDAHLLDVLALAFEDEGHDVHTAPDGAAGWALLAELMPDVILSDVNMPHLDGFSFCRKLREAKHTTPLLLLTSRADEIDEALGLELGADDYVTKPFSTRVLVARVAALLRREAARAGGDGDDDELAQGAMRLHRAKLQVRFHDENIPVTVSEFRLLEALVSRPGIVFTRDQLLDKVRGDESVVAQRIIDTYIRRLRRKLEAIDAEFDAIETVIGAGYRWASK